MLNRTNLFVFILLVICIPVVFAQEAPVLQLTNDPAFDGRPAWAPTGNMIAFISNRGKHTTLGDVWAINPDGRNLHQLTATPDNFEFGTGSIAWLGSTGDIVVLDTENLWEYFCVQLSSASTFPIVRNVVDGDSPFFERLLSIPGGLGSNSFAISPDGTVAAWTILTTPTSSCPWQSDFRIAPLASMNGDSGSLVGNSLLQTFSNCPSGAGESFRGIAFSPDGTEIVVSRNIDPNSPGFDLEVYKTDGTFVRRLTFNGTDPATPAINYNPSWSSDNRIAFASDVTGRFEIYTIVSDGSDPTPTQVTFNGGDWPSWSPDSSKIAFQSSRSGNSEIYLITKPNILGACRIVIAHESQVDARWAKDTYDDSAPLTVGEEGCALTVLSMALNFAGLANDPGSLNRFMSETDHDYDSGFVAWDAATQDASSPGSPFVSTKKLRFASLVGGRLDSRNDSISNPAGAFKQLNDELCSPDHHPVIVGVQGISKCTLLHDFPPRGTPGHYVLVTGKQTGATGEIKYEIADPGCSSFTSLDDYENEFVTVGIVKDPPGDVSQLDLALGDVGELLITDPQGNRTGLDGGTGEIMQEIPQSAYFRDRLDNDITGQIAGGMIHLVQIFQPTGGSYGMEVRGVQSGTYNIVIRPFAQDGSAQATLLLQGVAVAGSTSQFRIQFSPVAGAAPSAMRTATFQSTLNDIHNSLTLGLINRRDIADSLSQKVEAADRAAARGRSRKKARLLITFKEKISEQTKKHIQEIAAQMLLQDAEFLLSQ